MRQAVVSDVAGETVSFHVASNNGASSSMLAPGRHADLYPSITFDETLELVAERLDDIVAERSERADYNVLVLDVQGAELKVLKGAPELLARVDAVFTEVSSEPLYEGGCTFLEVTNLLAEAGLVFRSAEMKAEGWGDAFYSRRRGTLYEMLRTNLALGRPTRQSSYYGRSGQGSTWSARCCRWTSACTRPWVTTGRGGRSTSGSSPRSRASSTSTDPSTSSAAHPW